MPSPSDDGDAEIDELREVAELVKQRDGTDKLQSQLEKENQKAAAEEK